MFDNLLRKGGKNQSKKINSRRVYIASISALFASPIKSVKNIKTKQKTRAGSRKKGVSQPSKSKKVRVRQPFEINPQKRNKNNKQPIQTFSLLMAEIPFRLSYYYYYYAPVVIRVLFSFAKR